MGFTLPRVGFADLEFVNYAQEVKRKRKMHQEVTLIRRDRSGWSKQKILGDELRIARECLGLTQAQLGERIGLLRRQIGKVEKGERKLEWDEFDNWAKAVGRTTDFFCAIVSQELASRKSRHGTP
jgi:DNA-binding XRE family transcriptional regulator